MQKILLSISFVLLVFSSCVTPKIHNALHAEYDKTKAELENKAVYLAEIKQAGMFDIEGASGEIMQRFLNVNCLEIIFPYARENVSALIQKGGFPPLFLAPIDFNALFMQEIEKRKKKN